MARMSHRGSHSCTYYLLFGNITKLILSETTGKEIGVEEHDGGVRFKTGSGNMAVSRMRNEKYAI